MEKQEAIFPRGIFYNAPRENAPEYVKGSISIKADDAIPFLQEHVNEKGYINLDMLVSKEKGNIYLKLNTWKPKAQQVADDFGGRVLND